SSASLAISIADRLPAAHRAAWIRDTAVALVEIDPAVAFAIIEQRRTETDYGATFTAAVRGLSGRDPATAARYAIAQTDPTLHESAVYEVANAWAQRNTEAAHAWARTLTGEDRNRALDVLLAAFVAKGTFSADVLADYS